MNASSAWLLVLCLILAVVFSFTSYTVEKVKKSFILTSPKQLDAGSTERLSLVLVNVIGRGDVTVSLMDANDTVLSRCVTAVITSGLTQVYINLTVPHFPSEVTSGKLKVHGSCGRFRFFEERVVGIRHVGIVLFIASDKEIYLPGSRVKFRVLAVNSQLQSLGNLMKADVVITDPNGVCVSQDLDVSMSTGLVDLTFDLPRGAVLGLWSITVTLQNTKKTSIFTVDIYDPPKFQVTIIPPSYVLATARTLTWKICAEYASKKQVVGTIKLFAQLSKYPHEILSSKYSLTVEDKITGCYNYTVDCNRLGFFDATQKERSIELTAEVTERETGITEIARNSLCRVTKPVCLNLITHNTEEYFKPGLPYKGKLLVSTPNNTPMADIVILICIVVTKEQWTENRWEGTKSKFCKHFTSSKRGQVTFTVPPQRRDITSIQIKFRAILPGSRATDKIPGGSEPQLTVTLHPWYSPSGSFLQIETVTEQLICGNAHMFNVLFTTAEEGVIKFIYQLIARGEIVDQGILPYVFKADSDLANYTDDTYLPFDDHMTCTPSDSSKRYVRPSYIGRFNIILVPPPNLSPKAHFLLYYVCGSGETVADEKTFRVSGCFGNNISVTFPKEKASPKSNIAISIRGSAHSLCGISSLDKSARSLGGKNQLFRTQVFDILESYDVSKYTYPFQPTPDCEWCQKEYEGQAYLKDISNNFKSVGYVDDITAFNDAGLVVLTNNELETRPCKPYDFTSNIITPLYDQKKEKCELRNPDVTPRTFHSESWLWEIERLSADGSLTLIRKLPDVITKWSVVAVCISSVTGLGISVPAPVVAFQPFITTIIVPSSVIRGEIVTVIVTIVNYLQECISIQLELKSHSDFKLNNCTKSVQLCVCPESKRKQEFQIVPIKTGTIKVEVHSSSVNNQNLCSYHIPQAVISTKQVTIKEFQVLHEGFPMQEVKTAYFCFEKYSEVEIVFALTVPESVNNSTEVVISVTGDLMGPVLNDLHNLIRLPSGCGEQIMVDFVPNVIILKYLNQTNQLATSTRVRLLHNIQQGYIKILNFCHANGAYSPFGSRDLQGSVWLTSYILWSLEEASKHIFIDKDHLTKTRKWILSQQLENGCFPAIGMTIHSDFEDSVATKNAILTAYVVISLWNSGHQNDLVMYEKAVKCMKLKANHTDYSLALYSYAFSLIRTSEAQDYLNELHNSSITSGNLTFWTNGNSSNKALMVEIASYIVLAYLHLDYEENIIKITPVIHWIVQQRNPNGGFYSSQDTVMGIRALAKYAESVYRLNLLMTIDSVNHTDIKFILNSTHQFKKQSARIAATPHIALVANGTGCAEIQVDISYRVTTPPTSESFSLKLNTTRGINGNCHLAEITSCFSFPTNIHFSMIILQIHMVSGFSPVLQSLNKLLRNSNLELKKYEFENNQLVFYFGEPKNTSLCLSFEVIQLHFVSKLLPAIAKVSDYYDTEQTVSVFYTVDEECPKEQ